MEKDLSIALLSAPPQKMACRGLPALPSLPEDGTFTGASLTKRTDPATVHNESAARLI